MSRSSPRAGARAGWRQQPHAHGGERRLAHLATIGGDGVPHPSPVGYAYGPTADTIDIGGFNLERSKKYRDIQRTPALVVAWLRGGQAPLLPSPKFACSSYYGSIYPSV